MGRSTVHYADNKTNNALKKLHNKLRPAGTPVQRVEYIIELLLLRIFETKIKQDKEFKPLRKLFTADFKWVNPKTSQEETNENKLFSHLSSVSNGQILSELNNNFFPFYSTILQSARQVFDGNLPQKVQDQLVLIEEVFSNSNFTNNVNSGNLGEVITIVSNEIEETRLLQTDLLGDAIESALSETGGTKDIGLFRTPDHIRQFMTALVEPTFDDSVFDPACGTGGFLFDAFEFVMRRVDPYREWPGEKGHSELQEWFDEYFLLNHIDFPSIQQTRQFYRTGVTGVEYLGMIRKMAAINFYIRGLNPANIEQGDSLAKYRPVTDHESKSVILANPPFGAERDQEAYPDVWQEHSKESETTILFVKLMFEQLKQNGRCAVVVSEGFHTWDQFSAKALRKMLLEEANLKAVISLPQGLFVSKTGQGPKTSILVFEKGGKTDWVWFYKVTNDGYSMGTNRKEQKGNQLVECLTLWHEYVKHGKQPPETKHQFCVPVDWIKALDPRIKEKIRNETRAEMESKGKTEREKKETDWDKKIKAKKATEADKGIDLKVFEQMLENRIQNEIAKRIDKAHNYSLNLANYRSTLREDQLNEWKASLKHIKPNGAITLDEVYKKLNKGRPENSLPYLVKLNPANSLEVDIAREYVSNIDNGIIEEHKELYTIRELLKSGAKYPMVKLRSILEERNEALNIDDEVDYRQVTIKLWGKGVSFRGIKSGSEIQTKKQNVVREGDLIISRIDARNGAFGVIDWQLDGAIVTNEFPVFSIKATDALSKYVVAVLTIPQFYKQIEDSVEGASGRRRLDIEKFLDLEIPLPPTDQQATIVSQIEKQKSIIEGVDKVLKSWEVPIDVFNSQEGKSAYQMSDVCKFTGGSQPPKEMFIHQAQEGYVRLVQIRDFKSNNNLTFVPKDSVTKFFEEDDVMIARYGPPVFQILRGLSGAYNVALMKAIPNEDLVLKDYWFYYLQNPVIQKFVVDSSQRTAGQSGVNLDYLYTFQVFLPDKIEQAKVVQDLNSKMIVLDGLRKMKIEAEKQIGKMLADVWGVEYVEKMEIISEEVSIEE